MLEALYGAGLRVSELVGLNWNDVHWSARELRLFGKGSKERVVPLGQYALDALLVFAKHYQERFRKKAEGPLHQSVAPQDQSAQHSPDYSEVGKTSRHQ